MKKTMNSKVEVTKYINEDVVATSGITYTCDTSPYHLMVDNGPLSIKDDGVELCYLFKSKNGKTSYSEIVDASGDLPIELTGYGTLYHQSYFAVDLGTTTDVQADDMYYFTGSGWAKCNKDLSHHS